MGHWSGKKVAVLYGGRSAEREVSLKTGKACAEALRSRGLDVTLVDAGLDLDVRLRALGRRRGLRRPSRTVRGGRLRPGAPRVDGHPVHRIGRALLGHGHGQGALEAPLPRGRAGAGRLPGVPRLPRRLDRRGRPARRAAGGGEAGLRGLLGGGPRREGGRGARRRPRRRRPLQGGPPRRAVPPGAGGERRGPRRARRSEPWRWSPPASSTTTSPSTRPAPRSTSSPPGSRPR